MAQSNSQLTEQFFQESLPGLFEVTDEQSIHAAYSDYIAQVDELAGPRGGHESKVSWPLLRELVAGESVENGVIERDRRLALPVIAASVELYADNTKVKTKQLGTLLLLDGRGVVKAASSKLNPAVNPDYGTLDYFVLEKLGQAKVVEVLKHQGADWGEGYVELTNFLRKIGRIAAHALPHVGMATAHEIPYSDTTKGTDRNAIAYAAASGFTLDAESVHGLLSQPKYFEHFYDAVESGAVDNIADWLAGRVDSLVGRAAYELYLGRDMSRDFPDLDHPDYADVDNN